MSLSTVIQGYGEITALETPHRAFDAIFLDSVCKKTGKPFRESEVGRALVEVSPSNAGAFLRYAPPVLLFGAWDSHGPKGGGGEKYTRALSSEIIGLDCMSGVKTASRIDPLRTRADAQIFESKVVDRGWEADPDKAVKDKDGKPLLYVPKDREDSGKAGKRRSEAGSPAFVGHSNIPPDIDEATGGVSITLARQIAVLSLTQLRRLRFGAELQAEQAAFTALAALGLYALIAQYQQGYALRSRCWLLPVAPPVFEFLGPTARDRISLEIDEPLARETLELALTRARERGLGWSSERYPFEASDRLNLLYAKSRELERRSGPQEA